MRVLRGVLPIAGLLLLTLPVRAETRLTSFATFLHVGPGREYAVSDELPTRSTVEVAGCENDWCQIRYGGGAGWIEQRMLAAAAAPHPTPTECYDFKRTGWPATGDNERLCLPAPK